MTLPLRLLLLFRRPHHPFQSISIFRMRLLVVLGVQELPRAMPQPQYRGTSKGQ